MAKEQRTTHKTLNFIFVKRHLLCDSDSISSHITNFLIIGEAWQALKRIIFIFKKLSKLCQDVQVDARNVTQLSQKAQGST